MTSNNNHRPEATSGSFPKVSGIILAWFITIIIVTMGASFSPLTNIVLEHVKTIDVHVALGLPGLCLFVAFVGKPLIQNLKGTYAGSGGQTSAAFVLMLYALYVVTVTGGFDHSSFASCVAIIVLLSSKFVGNGRKRLLVTALIGALTIFIASHWGFTHALAIPVKYPAPWEKYPMRETILAYIMTAITCFLDYWLGDTAVPDGDALVVSNVSASVPAF